MAGNEKRVFKVQDIIFYLALALFLIIAVLFANFSSDKSVFGYRIFNVLTSSMESEIPKGSLVLVKVVDTEEIEIGDNITFYTDATTTVTHQVVDIYEDYKDSGLTAFITWGVDNSQVDSEVVLAANVVGKVVLHIPILGVILELIANNFILVIIIFVLIIILYFSLKIFIKEVRKDKIKGEHNE